MIFISSKYNSFTFKLFIITLYAFIIENYLTFNDLI